MPPAILLIQLAIIWCEMFYDV